MKTETELCQCNKCETVFIDTNPQIDAKTHEIELDLEELILMEDEDGYLHACPNCLTDAYLTDL